MRFWNLGAGDPLSLTIAADPRLAPTDYCDDQIWRLQLRGGDPPAVALYTTFGLRARSLRIFPLFTEDDRSLSDPVSFNRNPIIRRFYPNYLNLVFSPFSDIDVNIEYWVPESKAIAGRIMVSNRGRSARHIQLDLVAQLTPSEGHRMAPMEIESAPCLVSQTDGIHPLVFMTGGPKAISSPFPSLRLELDLQKGKSQQYTFSHAALNERQSSFDLARGIASYSWDAEITRIEHENAGLVEVYTGDQDWDICFALAQKVALNLFSGPTKNLPYPSFVFTRQPDLGFSLKGDGSDYNYLWNGQSPLESYYLVGLIVACAPRLAKGIVHNFLSSQTESGSVDWKPGLGGQRCNFLAIPILVSTSWRIYQTTEDRDFLEVIYERLRDFLFNWFESGHDKDGDGIPEWDHPTQAGIEDHPVYSRWAEWAQGIDISVVESPALCAFLFRECQSLIEIANVLDRTGDIDELLSIMDNLQIAIENSWSDNASMYLYWDRDTHDSLPSEFIGQQSGSGILSIQRPFEKPVRLHIRLHSFSETTLRPDIFIHGENVSGQHRIERIEANQFSWFPGNGTHTGQFAYSKLEQLEFKGLSDEVQIIVKTVETDTQDHTNLLPLWAGIPNKERADILVKETITDPNQYWYPFGIPAYPMQIEKITEDLLLNVHLPWNALIVEGLLQYGFREEAAELYSRFMKSIIPNLKEKRAFQQYYHAEKGQGSGERDALSGLAPLGLFLDILGVRLISSRKVHLEGINPFPWPVTVKYLGMSILRGEKSTTVTFPNGQSVMIDDPSPQYVSLVPDESGSG